MTPAILRSRLEFLARNLWWTWHPEVAELFRELDPTLWKDVRHKPLAFLAHMDDATLSDRSRTFALETRILRAARQMEQDLGGEDTWGATHAGVLNVRPVAYFSAEFGLHESLPIYSGGLGVLAGDHMKASSDLGVPVVGVGLLYRQGYFIQRLDASGWQHEEFAPLNPAELPLEMLRDASGAPLHITVQAGAHPVHAAVWRVRVGRNSILLLDTDIPGNPEVWREITHRLYWGDQSSRIRQELVLGVGGLRALAAAGIRPGVLHLNEGHSAFALLEAIRQELTDNGLTFEEARDRVAAKAVFTTHTPVPAGHDRFPAELLMEHFEPMRAALGISRERFLGLGRVDESDDNETFCMTVLALKLSARANGVSALHGEVSREMWQMLWPGRRAAEVPIGHITNGVHVRSWIAREVLQLAEHRLPAGSARDGSGHALEETLGSISSGALWEVHCVLKSHLIGFVRRRFIAQELRRGADAAATEARAARLLDPHALTLGFARRFATYKRATLLQRDRERLLRLLTNPERPVQMIFAGKAHPKDHGGKELIRDVVELSRDPALEGRVVFVEDYDMHVARLLVQGVDVWVNNPRRPEEACGTSGMKAALNGALNCSIPDGWWLEACDGRNGFSINATGPHADHAMQDARDHEALLSTIEREVVPLFFDRAADGAPQHWISRIRHSLLTLGWRFSAERMLTDYVKHMYLPAARGVSSMTVS